MGTWDDNKVTPSNMRLYTKTILERESSWGFVAIVRRPVN